MIITMVHEKIYNAVIFAWVKSNRQMKDLRFFSFDFCLYIDGWLLETNHARLNSDACEHSSDSIESGIGLRPHPWNLRYFDICMSINHPIFIDWHASIMRRLLILTSDYQGFEILIVAQANALARCNES